jgi:hypothetical protein
MTDESPQQPPRGRRARGSVDPGPEYPGDLPGRAYPPSQYPDPVPGQRRRPVPGDPQAARGYPAPPGTRGRLAGDAAPGQGRAGPPGESAVGYGPRTPAGESSGYGWAAPADSGRARPPGEAARSYDPTGAPREPASHRSGRPGETAGGYGPAGAPGGGTRGYARPPAPGGTPGYAGPAAPGEGVPGQGRGTGPGEGRRSYPAAPPRGPYDLRPDAGGRDAGRGHEPGPARGRRAAAPREEPGGPGDFYPDPGPRSGARPAPGAPDRGRRRGGDSLVPPGGSLPAGRSVPPGGSLPGGRSVPAGGPGVDGYLTAPPQQSRLDGTRSSQAGQATGELPAVDWTSAPRRGRRHRPEPHPEASLAPAVRDRPAERTGRSRHGRVPGGSGVGWDPPLEAGPGQAPATGPAGVARAAPGRTGPARADSGPLPPGRRSPEPVGRGRGGPAGFVADPEFDRDDQRGYEHEPARRPASRPSAIQPPPDPRAADEVGRDRRARGRVAVREAPAEHDEAGPARGERPPRMARPGRRSGRRRGRRMLMIGAGLAVLVGGAAVAAESGLFGSGPHHVLVTPDKLGSYVRRPQLEKQMNASQLQRQVIAKSAGQASHVVSAVYEEGTGAASTKTPQMILLIGGNLSGVSPAGFIESFTQQSKGAFGTSAGSLGGSAACVNAQASVPGSVALCTWADNDTFGVVASPTMSASRLAAQLRAIRPLVEHVGS